MLRPFATVTSILILTLAVFFFTQSELFSWAQTILSTRDTTPQPPSSTAPQVEAPSSTAAKAPVNSTGTRTHTVRYDEMMRADGDGMMGMMADEMMSSMGAPKPRAFREQFHKLTRALQRAKTPEQSEQAKTALKSLLGGYFDADMQRRQDELDQVKQRVARLEALFKKRQAAKQDIIDLQLKTMVNESEGLGFFSEPISSNPYGEEYGYYGMGEYDMEGGYEDYGGEKMEGYGGGGYGMDMHEEAPR